jgi:hypothetical protein
VHLSHSARRLVGVLAAVAALTAVPATAQAGTPAAPSTSPAASRVHYLTMARAHCYWLPTGAAKRALPVGCARRHQVQVAAVVHGGWGRTHPSRAARLAASRRVCRPRIIAYAGTSAAWVAFFPDAGAEANRYGDRVICAVARLRRDGSLAIRRGSAHT